MKFFEKDYMDFFKELEKNNIKDWFHDNKKRYEKSVKIPFRSFVEALTLRLQEIYPDVDLSDKFSIHRINRDIRFSKDKTPYKTQMSAMIMPHGVKDHSKPGLYIEASHKHIRVYSGTYMVEKDQLRDVRRHIMDNMEEFKKLINDKDFKSTYGEVQGEKNKRLDPEFREAAEKQPLIFNKHFYWYFELKANTLLKDSLIDDIVSNFIKTIPVNRFFEKALGV